jgi:hypothetical protein
MILLLGLHMDSALAALTGVTASPPMANCALGNSHMLNITWDVSYIGGPSDVFSNFGTLRAGTFGPVLSTVHRRLNRDVPVGSGNVIFRETVSIPEQALLRAQQLGFNQVTYTRDFEGMVMDSVTCNITGSSGAPGTNLTRIALRFPDNSRVKVMPDDVQTHVLADLTYTGSGRLEAVWEIAEPSSTSGNPSFRTMRLVRRQLLSGSQQITLRSPDIPTRVSGLYLLRFRVTSPAVGFESPVIRYFVNPALEAAPTPVSIGITAPAPGTVVDAATLFEWDAVPGAEIYQLEIRAARTPASVIQLPLLGEAQDVAGEAVANGDAGYPVTGIVIGGSTRHLSLSALALSRMPPGPTYWWRVQAYDREGRLIGSSDLRVIVVSGDVVIPKRPITPQRAPPPGQ